MRDIFYAIVAVALLLLVVIWYLANILSTLKSFRQSGQEPSDGRKQQMDNLTFKDMR